MSDYTQITDFSAKDGLTTGDPEKIILGADFDAELSAISTAIATKYDSNDIASSAQAVAGLLDTVLMTPLQVDNVLENAAGMLGDIKDLTDPNADTMLGWDDSAGAVINFSIGTGLGTTAGGALEISHLGLEDLVDPNADRIFFWDDSAGFSQWLTVTNGLEISATSLGIADAAAGAGLTAASGVLAVGAGSGITVNANDVQLANAAATTSNPIDVTSGAITIDLTALTNIEGNALAATDEFLVDDGGTPKAIRYQDAGVIVPTAVSSTANKTFTDAEMNQVWRYTGATDVLWDIDNGVGVQGNWLVFIQEGAGSIDISGGTATIRNASSHTHSRVQYSVMTLINVGSNVWYLYGDTAAT